MLPLRQPRDPDHAGPTLLPPHRSTGKKLQNSALPSQDLADSRLSPVTTENPHKGPADTGLADPTDPSTWKPNHGWARSPVVLPPRLVNQARDSQRLSPWRTYWPPPRVGCRAESRARGDTGRWEPRGVRRRPPSSGQHASLPLPTRTSQELRDPARSGRSVLRHRAARAHSGRGGRTPQGCPASTSEAGSTQNL